MIEVNPPVTGGPVRVTGTHDDVVQVTRKWDIEAPDFIPWCKVRAVAPRWLVARWVDGKLTDVGIWGPYRLKSGALSETLGGTGGTGTGSPDEYWMEHVTVDEDGRPGRFDADHHPAWMWDFLAEHGPVL